MPVLSTPVAYRWSISLSNGRLYIIDGLMFFLLQPSEDGYAILSSVLCNFLHQWSSLSSLLRNVGASAFFPCGAESQPINNR